MKCKDGKVREIILVQFLLCHKIPSVLRYFYTDAFSSLYDNDYVKRRQALHPFWPDRI